MKIPIEIEDLGPQCSYSEIYGDAQPLYVSYKKSPASTRFLRRLKKELPESIGLVLFEEVGGKLYQDIPAYMAQIANADLVLILLSDEYLKSQYCLTELLFTFVVRTGGLEYWMSDSQEHADIPTDMEGVVPIILNKLETTRSKCAKHWEKEANAFAKRIKNGSWYTEYDTHGDALRPLIMANPKFKPLLIRLMDWVFGTLAPLGAKLGTDGKGAIVDFIKFQASNINGKKV